jgi:hypothetical protein
MLRPQVAYAIQGKYQTNDGQCVYCDCTSHTSYSSNSAVLFVAQGLNRQQLRRSARRVKTKKNAHHC